MKYHDVLVAASSGQFMNFDRAMMNNDMTRLIYEPQRDIPQGTMWHPEFTLGRHIFLVCKGLMSLNAPHLLETALFHDVGKRTTTCIGRDRIFSYDHDKVGVVVLQDLVTDPMEMAKFQDYALVERITALHMKYNVPTHPKLKNDEDGKIFVSVDKIMGSDLAKEHFQDITLKMLAKMEQQLYDKGMISKKHIFVTVGIPGSGKSTYLKKHYLPEQIICPDKIREEVNGSISDQSNSREIWALAKERLLALLTKGNTAVLDATGVVKANRIKFLSSFNHCRKVALVFPTKTQDAKDRIAADMANKVNRSDVPDDVVDKMQKLFYMGKSSLEHEFHEVLEVNSETV